MNKRNLWTRAMAFVLAAVMILTSQTVSSMGETLSLKESQQQDVLSGEEDRGQDIVQNGSTYDEEGLAEENTASDSQGITESEPAAVSEPVSVQPVEDTADQPVDLKDETTSVRVTGDSGVLPADTVMTAEALAADRLPAGAQDAVDSALAEKNLTAQDRAFYDISMNDAQPSGTVRVWLPIPDEWNGVLDAWYIDAEGHVQNLDAQTYNAEETSADGKRYYVFDTNHFSIYGVTVSQEKVLTVSISSNRESAFPGDQVTLSSTVSEEGAVLQWQYKTKDGEWQNIPGENSTSYSFAYSEENEEYEYRLQAALGDQTVYSDSLTITRRLTLRETAELYYGKNGTQDTANVSVRLEETDTSFKAGDTVTMMISYSLQAAALYNYGEQAVPMFDTYNDTKIRFKLPEGMSLSLDADAGLDNVKLEGPTNDNVYTFVLNDSINASSDGAGSFLVNVKIENNGKLEANHQFNFGETDDFLVIETKFDINGAEDDWPDDLKNVTKQVAAESAAPVVTSATDDEWMIQKTADGFTVSEDRTTVTVHYNLAVGLKGTDGQIVTNQQTYGRIGRVPFDGNVVLTDVPTVRDRSGAPISYTSITVKKGETVVEPSADGTYVLPMETCGDHQVDGVDADAPYYSTFTVDVVYPAEKFIAKYSDADQSPLTVNNSAEISYRLAGIDEDKTSSSNADQEVNEVIPPAKLTISKYIVDYADGSSSLYTAENFTADDPVSGPVTFKVTDEDGNAPTLYKKNADGTYTALEITDGLVTINPADTSGADSVWTDGTIEVYLDAGTYMVSETDTLPSNTVKVTADENNGNNAADKEVAIAEEGSGTADFYNRETLGSISIDKKGKVDGVESDLMGAEFGLYRDEACEDPITSGTTDNQGDLTFGRLTYGTYYVKEIEAPNGYIKDDKVYEVELTAENAEQTVTSVNLFNNANIKLQKKVLDIDSDSSVDVDQSNYQIFANRFTLQRKTSGGSWDNPETVEENLSLGQDGTISRILPAYDGDGNVYTYRFVENLPEGWHGAGETLPDASGSRFLYSKEFTLENNIGNGSSEAVLIEMENWRNGSIDLTKKFWDAGSGGMAVNNSEDLTASFDLYYKEGNNSTYIKYNTDSYTAKAGETISITDLPRTTGETGRYYYLVETSTTDGYALSGKTEGFAGTNSAEKTTINVNGQNLTAYGPFNFTEGDDIKLQQSITIDNVQQKVPVVVKKVNSYTNGFVSGTEYKIYEYDESAVGKKGAVVIDSTEISSAGSLAKLDPGKKYIVEESVIPQGYENVTDADALIINLEDIKTVDTDTTARTVTLKNRPDPKIQINKKIKASDGTEAVKSGVTFEVYTKVGETFTQVSGYDEQPLKLSSGSRLQLPAGTYYLKEVAPDGVLDPSKYESLYDDDYAHEYADGSYYFGPYEVKDQEDVQNLGTIVNYSDKGEVRVKKSRMTLEGKKVALPGAQISIYREGESDPVKTAESVKDTGFVTFKDLPIYDENGAKITYIIRETAAPAGYTASEKELKVQLSPGVQVTADTEGNNLEIINQPETSLRVSKVYYNIWENQFTHKEYFLPGTEIALYRLDGEVYKYVDCKTTNSVGEVVFTGLTQKDEYVAVEVSIPDDEAYQYLEPIDKKDYLQKTAEGECPDTIPKNDIGSYNIVTKPANTVEDDPQSEQTGKLTNVENWAQLKVEKFAIGADGQADEGVRRELNNAEFELYQQIVDPEDGTALAFDSSDPDTTLVGSYTSGTLYDKDGIRQDGYFATDILKCADNVVYWLVEKTPGIGGKLKPQNAITLIRRAGTSYTNNSTYEGTPCIKYDEYKDNVLTEVSVENDPAYGGDGERFSTVRIAKWAGSYTKDGDKVYTYTPLGNTSFDLYLAAEDGTLVEKIDTLTTGLDNNLSEGTGAVPTSALASSKAFSWTTLTSKYQEDTAMYNRIFQTDKDGNSYARVALVETDAPDGYTRSGTTYYMYMFFRYEEAEEPGKTKTTESFNDVFYVKDKEEKVDLAEGQNGIFWGLYATEENTQGGYDPISISDAPEEASQQQYRLVNWPVDNFAVTVTKYGYEPVEGANMGKTSEELDAYYSRGVQDDRVPLANVTMRLERLVDGEWKTYAYSTYDGPKTDGLFTTDRNGYFAFPRGLDIGQYRIVEVTPNADYENIYDLEREGVNSDYTGDAAHSQAAYYFDVTADNVDISMYNPKKLTLDIQKYGMDTDALSDVTFTLTSAAGNRTAETGQDGKAHLTGIGNGTYKLTESEAAGHTNEYLKEYFKEAYDNDAYKTESGNLNDLVNGNGIFFGYKTMQIQNEDGSYSVTVTHKVDINDYGIKTSEGVTLTVQNPETQDLTITKIDKDTKAKLKGAAFKIEYQRFPVFSGDVTLTDSGWSTVNNAAVTDDNGQVILKNQKPGVYKITETAAPKGYDITDTAPRYVALTGSMNIGTVKVGEISVTKNTDQGYGEETLTFADAKQVKLTVNKDIIEGNLKLTGSSKFTFQLLDENKTQITSKTVTCTDGQVGSVDFTGLSQGKTYYLRESIIPAGYQLTAMKDGEGSLMTADGDGYYRIEVPDTDDDLTVTAENTYLYAELSIRKVDGEDGTPLSGAGFSVYADPEKKTPVSGIVFTEGETGVYTARIPLTGTGTNTFYIFEKTAPDGYPKEEALYIKADLTPGQKITAPAWDKTWANENATMLANYIFPNYRGAYVDLVKYGNVREGNPTADDVMSGVTLRLYEKSGDTWIESASEITDEEGKVRFTVVGGRTYAVAEPSTPDGWKELQGIWAEDAAEDAPAAATETAEINGQTVTLHMLKDGKPLEAGTTYQYNAYNTPYVELEIRKQNALDPYASAQPTATVSVYEIAEDANVTDAFVENLLLTGTPVRDDIWVQTPGSSETEGGKTEHYNYANNSTWTEMGSKFLAGKTYLAVETDSSVSQIRDNNKVEWYKKVTIPEGTTGKTVVTLKNIEGNVTLDLAKTAKDQTQESLFTQGADLEYTIRPTVGNTYPLDSFTLTDTGLTAYHGTDNAKMDDSYLYEKYSINEVVIGKAEHDVSGYLTEGTAPITAEVTFYGFDGEPIGTVVAKDVSTSAQTFTLAEAAPDAENAKAKTFTVSYHADALAGTGYDLGTDFKPGVITARARADQQAGGEDVQSIDLIRNSVSAEVKYTPWEKDGSRGEQKSIPDNAAADVKFSPQDAAVVTVEKQADQESVALNSNMTYSITLKNEKDAAAAMEDPFIVDLLPQGTTWVSGSEKEIVTDSKTLTFSNSSSGRAKGETAVYVNLDGFLKPGEYVTIKITVEVGEAAAGYGTSIQNYVLAGSEIRGAQSDVNPQAASFKNENGNWAESMDNVLTSMDETRRDSLREILEASGRENYGYISAAANANWTTSTDISLVKSGYGDRNQEAGFTSDQLSTVNNNGWMRYRLTATNTSSVNAMTGISMVDILPKPGDYRTGADATRKSDWGLNYGSIDSVSKISLEGETVPLAENTDYKVYYYRGALDSEADYQKVYDDAKTLKFDALQPLPTGWSTDAPEPDVVDASVRAFAVAFNDNISLVGRKSQETGEAYQSAVVEYTAKVEDFDVDELQENAYDNAVNSFACHYSQYTAVHPDPVPIGKVLGSNVVSNTILQEPVKVGGHIWIDKNADGQRQEDESIDKFSGNSKIQSMLENVEIRLYRYHKSGSAEQAGTYKQEEDENWYTAANYIFNDLDPAELRDDATDQDAYGPDGKTLNVEALKGTDPAAYAIAVTLPSENIAGKFAVTTEGETNGRSYHPEHIPAAEQTDSNFTAGANTNTSELFYLWPTDVKETFDNTKDIGLIPLRDLEITKKAADGEQPAVEGAEFKIYGPFAENADEYDLSDKNLVSTVTTGADGKAVAEDLRWYQKYVIVETSASTGYIKEGAAATGGEGTNITSITLDSGDPAWVLGVPDENKTSSTDQVTVTNKRTVDIQLGAEKVLKKGSAAGELLDVEDGVFTFYLKDDEGTVLQTKTNNSEGKVTFDKITLEGVGTFTYYISEAVPTGAAGNVKDGITYDPADHKVVVQTEWTDAGLKATYQYVDGGEWSENAAGTTITNIYNAAGTWTPEGTKTLTGRDMAEDETFYFAVIDEGGAVVSTGTASGGKDGEAVDITFTPISYELDDAGQTFTYTIKETDAGGKDLPAGRQENGMTYHTTPFEVSVQVTDNGKGTLVPDAKYPSGGAAFENTYTPAPITYTPAVKKILSGNPVVKDETFEFKIEKTSGPEVTFANDTASVTYKKEGGLATGEQTVPFGDITFSQKGTYEFRITETTQSGNDKIDYDDASWTFTVEVTDDGNGSLSYADPVYDSSNPDEQDAAQAVFRNTYTPTPAEQPLKVTKQVDGNARPADAEFKFTLTEKSATTEGGAVLPATTELTVNVSKDQASNVGTFDPITFNSAGTYVFTITEEQTGVPGYVYDTTTARDVQVTVIDENGTLKVTDVQYQNSSAADSAVFTNHYDPENAFYTPKVKKTLTVGSGSGLPQKVNFTFELTQIRTDESPEGGVVTADGDTPVGTQTVSTADMTGPGAIDNLFFNKLEFTKAGTYYFQITEKADTAGYKGFTYDGTTWTLTVKVNDNNGTLEIPEDGGITYTSDANPPADAAQAEFSNSYASAPTGYSPKVKKTIESIFVPEKKGFTFNITNTGTTDGVNMPENTSVTVSGAGEGIFDEIGFTKTGTYTFDISETDGKLPGYDYDENHWTLTVVVGDSVAGEGDEAKGQLVVNSVSYVQSVTNTPSDTEAEFTNTYTAEPDSITPQVEKVINGADYPQDNKKVFTFHLTADAENEAEGASLEADDGALTAAVTGEGIGSFSGISFYKPGEYRFHISEDDSNKENGYTYDKHTWTLTVTVTDEDSKLSAVGTYTQDDADPAVTNPENAVFTNTYAITDSEELVIPVEKKVTGDVPFGRDQTFKFLLEQKAEDPVKAVLPDDTEIEIKGSGNSAFDAVTFEKAGDYTFKVTEEPGSTDGYSYDGSIWYVKVKVKDVESVLTIDQVVYEKGGNTVGDAKGVSFENSYSTVATKYTPQAEKDVTGDRVTTDKEFTFTLEPDEEYEGVELTETEASVTGEGRTSFGEITFNKAGIYTFTIRETDGGQNGYTYDERPWKLTVQVDDVDHILTKTSIVYSREADGTKSEECAVFTNAYDAKAVLFAPAVEKKVTGDVPEGKDQTFTFTMSAAEDNPEGAQMPEPAAAEVTGSGSAEFGEITFEQSGVYSFEIREENGGAPGYSYDGNVWTVTVNVEDNNGILEIADVVYTRAGEIVEGAVAAVFENNYDPAEVSYAPQVVKKITGDETPADRNFYFSLKADEENGEGAVISSDKAKITGAGSTNFGEITFSKAGVYQFLITEDQGGETGYTYDDSQWTLTVTVTDENGALKVSSAVYAKNDTDSSSTEAAEFINRYEAAKPVAAKTGDGMNAGRSAALMAGSAFLIGVVFCIRRKRRGSIR